MAGVNAVGVAAETAMESAKADWVAEMVEEWMPNKARLRTSFNGRGTRLHKNHVSVQRTPHRSKARVDLFAPFATSPRSEVEHMMLRRSVESTDR
jgi:hypothetical protein